MAAHRAAPAQDDVRDGVILPGADDLKGLLADLGGGKVLGTEHVLAFGLLKVVIPVLLKGSRK